MRQMEVRDIFRIQKQITTARFTAATTRCAQSARVQWRDYKKKKKQAHANSTFARIIVTELLRRANIFLGHLLSREFPDIYQIYVLYQSNCARQ